MSAGELCEPINPDYEPPKLTTVYEVEVHREDRWRVASKHHRLEDAEWASERIASRGVKTRIFRTESIRTQL